MQPFCAGAALDPDYEPGYGVCVVAREVRSRNTRIPRPLRATARQSLPKGSRSPALKTESCGSSSMLDTEPKGMLTPFPTQPERPIPGQAPCVCSHARMGISKSAPCPGARRPL